MSNRTGVQQEPVLDRKALGFDVLARMQTDKLNYRKAARDIGVAMGTLSRLVNFHESSLTVETLVPVLHWLHGPELHLELYVLPRFREVAP